MQHILRMYLFTIEQNFNKLFTDGQFPERNLKSVVLTIQENVNFTYFMFEKRKTNLRISQTKEQKFFDTRVSRNLLKWSFLFRKMREVLVAKESLLLIIMKRTEETFEYQC